MKKKQIKFLFLDQIKYQDYSNQIRDNINSQAYNSYNEQSIPIFFHEEKLRIEQDILNKVKCNRNSLNLIVICHGFRSRATKMKVLEDLLKIQNPDNLILVSKINEDRTDDDIFEMGLKLSNEIKDFIAQWCPITPQKFHFIGHSLGGIIIRSALQHLQIYKEYMGSYVSLSSPHLGITDHQNNLVKIGLWFSSKISKSICLNQLQMKDADDPFDSFLYRLSLNDHLDWFQNIYLVSSHQDQYIPFTSARLQRGKQDKNKQNILEQMTYNIINKPNIVQINRIEVNFQLQDDMSIDNLIGRSAHIQFLECEKFTKMMLDVIKLD